MATGQQSGGGHEQQKPEGVAGPTQEKAKQAAEQAQDKAQQAADQALSLDPPLRSRVLSGDRRRMTS